MHYPRCKERNTIIHQINTDNTGCGGWEAESHLILYIGHDQDINPPITIDPGQEKNTILAYNCGYYRPDDETLEIRRLVDN